MPFSLLCGDFHPWLEREFVQRIRDDLAARKNPLKEPLLAVVPTQALRGQLLQALSRNSDNHLFDFKVVPINQLCIELALNTLNPPGRIVSDSIFFPFVLYSIATKTNNTRFNSYRICAALYQTLRDLTNAAISSEHLDEVLKYSRGDSEIKWSTNFKHLELMADIYRAWESFIAENGIINPQTAASIAAANAAEWIHRNIPSSIYMYGFYDSTQSQFNVLETLIREVLKKDGNVRIFFPFRIKPPGVAEHPAAFSQRFYGRIYSLCCEFEGKVRSQDVECSDASGGVEKLLFVSDPDPKLLATVKSSNRMTFISSAGPYDEAWAVAKRILNLVRNKNVRFDQILVISRSNSSDLLPLVHTLAENHIPYKSDQFQKISFLPFARFALLTLRTREAQMNNTSLLQFLSSPFLSDFGHMDFRNVRKLMEELFIKNWNDWDRLKYLREDLIDAFPALKSENEESVASLRSTVNILFSLKTRLLQIPESGSLPEFARVLLKILQDLCAKVDSDIKSPILAVLQRIADYPALDDFTITLPEFTDLLKQHFEAVEYESDKEEAPSCVIVGDIMQLRGSSADYVFIIGLNKDVFPRRVQEDPFLPDSARIWLRSLTSLLPLKRETDEELLLFSLAIRSSRKQLFLCYQRANEQGQKLSCSTYLDETLRLLTGKISNKNDAVLVVPKHHNSKFSPDILPTIIECSALPNIFRPKDIVSKFHNISSQYLDSIYEFGTLLNSKELEQSKIVDGCITSPIILWSSIMTGTQKKQRVRLSYSRFKSYLQCPFQFYASEILRVRESPRDTEELEHDLNPLLKGRVAEAVIKNAIRIMREENFQLESAVSKACDEAKEHYSVFLPQLLLNSYMDQFHQAAVCFFEYLQKEGFHAGSALTPDYDEIMEETLVPEMKEGHAPEITIYGIPDLLLSRERRPPILIGELKWGSRSVGNTPGKIFSSGEAQFCIYPILVQQKTGKRLPFQYFRLDAFFVYGLPQRVQSLLIKLGPSARIEVESVRRLFGERIMTAASGATESASQEYYFKLCQKYGRAIQSGQFRILEDPSLYWSACGSCGFTQICRKTHTATLLRSKKAER